MASLKSLKEKISGIKKTHKVTKAMESISAIKMRVAQEKALLGREYSFLGFSILKRVSKVVSKNIDEIFLSAVPQDGKIALFLVSPDKGLTGGMNNFLFKEVLKYISDHKITKEKIVFICVGKKGYEFAQKEGFEVIKYFSDISEKSSTENLAKISEYIEAEYRKNEYAKIIAFYTNFINTSEQKAVHKIILPIVYEELKNIIKDAKPTKGKYSDLTEIDIDHSDVDAYIFEPSIEEAIKDLIPFLLHIITYNFLLESFASEHSARMLAMKNSTDKAEELGNKFRKEFNKERQAQITKEISEIVSGIEARKK